VKIAFPTDDGISICQHFGRARHYLIVHIAEGGAETKRELISKSHGEHNHNHDHDHHDHKPPEGIFAPLEGCAVVIAGGMGEPAHKNILQLNAQVVMTRQQNIDTALTALMDGSLENEPSLVHAHGHGHHH
jgi:predicted Fe-Mo cluster-binding NifX family protein